MPTYKFYSLRFLLFRCFFQAGTQSTQITPYIFLFL